MSGKWFSVMVLSVFGDESADETKQRVFAVSGVLGFESDWAKAEKAWTDLTKGDVFHAADWEWAGRHEEYKALALALAGSSVGGIVYSMDLAAYDAVYPDTAPHSAYLKCFTRVIAQVASNAETFNAHEPTPITKIEYTFDNRPEIEYSAAKLYDLILSEPENAVRLMATKVSFECRSNPRIQMADMIAREGMKELDRKVCPVPFPERTSKIELGRNNHFRFFELRREDFEAERARDAPVTRSGGDPLPPDTSGTSPPDT